MRLFLLGTGTCLGPLPGVAARLPPLFALDTARPGEGPAWLLLECSEGARWRLPAAGIDPAHVHHVAVSHPHADHAALPQFLQGRSCESIYRRTPGLDLSLYLPPECAADLPSIWRWHQPEDEGKGPGRYPFTVIPTDHGFAREIAPGVTLRAYRVHHGHGRSPAVAFRVEAHGLVFAYSGDTGPCEGVREAARGADLFLCEASARIGVDMSAYGHLTPAQAGQIAAESGARRLVLTHHTGLDPDESMIAEAATHFTGETRVAHDGGVIELAAGAT
jgi:ribonuclease BN (tRNA processing enzyme)